MKKALFIFFALISITTQAQVANGTETKQNAFRSMSPQTATTVNYLTTMGTDGTMGRVTPVNVTIPTIPLNYTVLTPTLGAHLSGIDTRLGQISSTTAGLTQRIYFTADDITVNSVVYFASNSTGKGATAAGSPPALVLADNTKGYFTKDLISIPQPAATIGYAGSYSGNLTVSATPAPVATRQRFTVEVYRTNNLGAPIASGVSGAPVGDLGVTVVAILDSGELNINAGAITNVAVNGILTQNITINTGERLRYHVSAAKIGAGGGNVTFQVYYGSSYNSYYDVPVAITTDAVVNKSTVVGVTDTDALNNLKTADQAVAGVGVTYGHITDGAQTIAGVKTFNNIDMSEQVLGGNAFGIKQIMANNDFWRIYGADSGVDKGELIFELGDNGQPFSSNGQIFKFHYDASNNGSAKDPLIIEYNDITANANITATSFIKSGSTPGDALLAGGGTLTNPVSGTGTTNYLPKFTGASTLGNSLVYDNGTNVLIGTTTDSGNANDKLQIQGGGIFKGSRSINLNTVFGNIFISGEADGWDIGTFYKGSSGTILGGFGALGNSNTLDRFYIGTSFSSPSANFYPSGVVQIPNLSGTGTRTVVADASGNLSATATPPARPYLVYTALISQSGTSAPTATVLENTLGGTVVWTRATTGQFTGTLSGAFTANKTIGFFQYTSFTSPSNTYTSAFDDTNINTVDLRTSINGTLSDSFAGQIEIRVYP